MRHFDDGSEAHEAQIRRVELVEPREEAPAAYQLPTHDSSSKPYFL